MFADIIQEYPFTGRVSYATTTQVNLHANTLKDTLSQK